MENLTKKEATQKWVREFNAINSSLLERAFKDNIDNWIELTPIKVGDYVYYNGESCTVIDADYEKSYDGIDFRESKLTLELNQSETELVDFDSVNYIYYNNELVEVRYTEENAFVVITDEGEESINFENISEIDYNDVKVKVLSVEDDCFEVEVNMVQVDYYDVDTERDGWLPMWGTLWTFGCGLDEDWARSNPDLVADCGFRIFEDDETGDVYIGIDGAGYDFYEHHWIPLYTARGLKWHSEE